MKVSDLTDAPLDCWTARAEGVPTDQLEIRTLQLGNGPNGQSLPRLICVRSPEWKGWPVHTRIDYSTNWAMGGPLVERLRIYVTYERVDEAYSLWLSYCDGPKALSQLSGNTALIAICRAVVRAAFGDEVPELEPA